MANSFAAMKRSNKSKDFEALAKKLEDANKPGGGGKKDDRFYYPETDKTGTGYAIIRFLPAPEGEDLAWVKKYSHGFKAQGGWYIEECPTSIEKECPVCKANGELWNSGLESDKQIVRDRKRKLHYIANIYVVQDSKHPENEGKVFLFRFGSKIFGKIQSAVKPEFEDETPIDPFDLWEGANFKLKIRKVENQTNYDTSTFEAPSQLLPSDEALEKVWKSEYKLSEFTSPELFKDYEKLEARYNKVVGTVAPTARAENLNIGEEDNEVDVGGVLEEDLPESEEAGADEMDTLDYFAKLAEED